MYHVQHGVISGLRRDQNLQIVRRIFHISRPHQHAEGVLEQVNDNEASGP